MIIEINSENFSNNPTAKSLIVDIITNAVNDFLGDKIPIDKIIVSDEKNHGKDIEKIQIQYNQTIGYTNNNGKPVISS